MFRKICLLCLVLSLLVPLVLIQVSGLALAQAISSQDLEKAGMNSIVSKLGGSDDYEITTTYLPPGDIEVPEGQISLKGEIPYGIRLNAPTIVNILISTDDQLYRNIGLRFNVRKFSNVLVVSRNMAAHDIFTEDCVRSERRDVARLAPGYIKDLSEINGMAARRMLREGTILTDAAVEKPVIVKRGSMITLIARIGNIEVTAAGQALQNAAAGQVIRARNLGSQKIIMAQVLDETSAQVLTFNGR